MFDTLTDEEAINLDPFDLCDSDGFPLDLSEADDGDIIVEDLAYPAQCDDPNDYRSALFLLTDPTLSDDPDDEDF